MIFFLRSKKMANIIFKVKTKSYFPRFSSAINFILNSSAFYYAEYNNPLFYEQYMLSVLIFWHKKKILQVFPSPILCHSWYWKQSSSAQVFPIFSMI